MTLPLPRVGIPPAVAKLTSASYAAILDDDTIDRQIRISVLYELESSPDPAVEFANICRDEELAGPHLTTGPIQVGRAISLDSFERGLTSGWFGAHGMDSGLARSFVSDLKATLSVGGSSVVAAATIQATLDPGTPTPVLAKRVTWYYYDDRTPADVLSYVSSDIAHRLALPSLWGKKYDATNPVEFIIFALPTAAIDDPRKPRFTDSGELKYLEVWRPGGKTVPWVAGCAGLDEVVGGPTILAHSVTDVRIALCYEP